ncbi:unnamed protein product [Mycena citricolor]|uniref:Uncharacterized protein n=1 Tax=Mycena citricolor TaxID=2018698 RepID=A0AAD2K0U9_9AGAR|nr:unnamed protein product [Mycena citricolor]
MFTFKSSHLALALAAVSAVNALSFKAPKTAPCAEHVAVPAFKHQGSVLTHYGPEPDIKVLQFINVGIEGSLFQSDSESEDTVKITFANLAQNDTGRWESIRVYPDAGIFQISNLETGTYLGVKYEVDELKLVANRDVDPASFEYERGSSPEAFAIRLVNTNLVWQAVYDDETKKHSGHVELRDRIEKWEHGREFQDWIFAH